MTEENEVVEEAQELEEVAQLKERLASRENELASVKEQLAVSVARYRSQVLASAPEIPQELIQGGTVGEIDASLTKAQEIVDRVKWQIEATKAAERVPAGAPPRTAPDLSELSPRDKIAYALTKK
jgi:hypothetical protein